jgi:hypothetical protein
LYCFGPVFGLSWAADRADTYFFNRLGYSANYFALSGVLRSSPWQIEAHNT